LTNVTGVPFDALWLDTLQRICGLAAHEVKGALNGVSVNLEVVRSRAAKPDVPAANVSKFANSASEQLDVVIAMAEALLGLSRPPREPVQPAAIATQVGALLVPAARADGRSLALEALFDDSRVTSADGSVVRIVVASCLLGAMEQSSDARCRAESGSMRPVLRIESCDGGILSVSPDVVAAATSAGIEIVAESSAITISFPRESGEVAETA